MLLQSALRWAKANSSALSGSVPNTLEIALGDLNGKPGRTKWTGARASTFFWMVGTNLLRPSLLLLLPRPCGSESRRYRSRTSRMALTVVATAFAELSSTAAITAMLENWTRRWYYVCSSMEKKGLVSNAAGGWRDNRKNRYLRPLLISHHPSTVGPSRNNDDSRTQE